MKNLADLVKRLFQNKKVRSGLYLGVFLATLYFVYRELSFYDIGSIKQIEANNLILSGFFFCVFYVVQSIGWAYVFKLYEDVSVKKGIFPYFASQIFKYLPTSVFSVSSRVKFTTDLGAPVKEGVKAVFLDAGVSIATSLVLFTILLEPLSAVILLPLLITSFYYWPKVISLVAKIPALKVLVVDRLYDFKKVYPALVYYFVSWGFAGLSIYFFLESFADFTVLEAIAFQSASYGASLLAVFAPGGLGVKEYILSFLSVGGGLLLAWRAFTIIFDVVFSSISIGLIKVIRHKGKGKSGTI